MLACWLVGFGGWSAGYQPAEAPLCYITHAWCSAIEGLVLDASLTLKA